MQGAHPRVASGLWPPTPKIDRPLVKAIARGVTWYNDLVFGRAASAHQIAEREGVDERFVMQHVQLAFLAPDLVEQAMEGTGNIELEPGAIARGLELPILWPQQQSEIS